MVRSPSATAPEHGRDAAYDARLRHHGGHEPDHDHREDDDGQIAVECCEVAERHVAGDHEAAAERQDHQRRHIRAENNDWNQAGEQPQDGEPDVARVRDGDKELLILIVLRVEYPDERRAEDAFVDDFVQTVHGLLRLREQMTHPSKDDLEGDTDDWKHGEDGEAELPVDGQE